MARMRTLLKYALWVILFFIFSEVLININLESTYNKIERKDSIEQITIYQAEATKVNGRIKGTIFNDENNKIENTYLKIDLYSARDILLGSRYIDISNLRENETREFEAYFKIQDVETYEISFVDEKDETGELPEMLKDLSKPEIIWGTFLAFLIFW